MFNWLNNPWVIGVGGGIISSLFILWITPLIFSKRYEGESQEKAAATNREVIYALRPGIPEGVIPSRDVVEALVHATARKYGAPLKYVHDCVKIGEELIKEVMDSSFISAKQKAEYCEALKSLMEEPLPRFPAYAEPVAVLDSEREADRSVFTRWFAMLLATITGLMTAVSGIYFVRTSGSIPPSELATLLLPTLIAIAGVTATVYYMRVRELLQRRRRSRRDSESVDASPNE
jgi:hypothetical protein